MDSVTVRYTIVWLWLLSGVLGVTFRAFLCSKFVADLSASKAIGASDARRRVSIRGIQSAILHMGVKGLIALIGVLALVFVPRPTGPISIFEFALDVAVLLIPWLGMIDAFLEWRHQDWLLYERPVEDVKVEEVVRTAVQNHEHLADGGIDGNSG